MVAANSSRIVTHRPFFSDCKQNTPLVFLLNNECSRTTVKVFSGGIIYDFVVYVTADENKFSIPGQLDVASRIRF